MANEKITSNATQKQIAKLKDGIQFKEFNRRRLGGDMESIESQLKDLAENASEALELKEQARLKQVEIDKLDAEIAGVEAKVSELNVEMLAALEARIAEVNGKAREYTMTALEVVWLAEDAEQLLADKGVTQKNRVGTVVEFRPAGKVASKSYQAKAGASITTHVRIKRVTDGWRLVQARRDSCYVNQREFRELKVRPEAHQDILDHAVKGIGMLSA